MPLADQITADLKDAMRAKDSAALTLLRSLKSALTNATIDKAGAGGQLDAAAEIAVVRTAIKQRQDSVEKFTEAGRTDLADNERAEIALLERYLPAPLGEEELDALIAAAIEETGAGSRKDMGKVMALLQQRTEGRADNKTLAGKVGAKLG